MFPANKIRIKIVMLEGKPLENMQLTILEFKSILCVSNIHPYLRYSGHLSWCQDVPDMVSAIKGY